MTEFLNLMPPQEALSLLISNLPKLTSAEVLVPSIDSMGSVVASDILSPFPLPTFPRSSVDGYALLSKDTYGASDSLL